MDMLLKNRRQLNPTFHGVGLTCNTGASHSDLLSCAV